MNKFKYFFILLIALTGFVSCNKDDDNDDVAPVPLRDYAVQYKADNDSIEKYLKTNYIEVDQVTFDVKITKIPVGGTQISIWNQTDYPLETRDVYNDGITYKVYYMTLNKGVGEAPCNYDGILASYTGNLLNGTEFDSSYNLGRAFNLDGVGANGVFVEGWREIFPKFKSGKAIASASGDGTITYTDFGAGVMFLPSGLAYYSQGSGKVTAYAPLVFTFKLFDIQRFDHDGDGIADFNEDLNRDGYVYDFRSAELYPNPPASLVDDTDKDGVADFIDIDDDGDGYTTKLEITKPAGKVGVIIENGIPINYGPSKYFPFEKFDIADDLSTPNIDESLNSEPNGIPAYAATGEPDYTSPGRLRIHLDKDHHTAKP